MDGQTSSERHNQLKIDTFEASKKQQLTPCQVQIIFVLKKVIIIINVMMILNMCKGVVYILKKIHFNVFSISY